MAWTYEDEEMQAVPTFWVQVDYGLGWVYSHEDAVDAFHGVVAIKRMPGQVRVLAELSEDEYEDVSAGVIPRVDVPVPEAIPGQLLRRRLTGPKCPECLTGPFSNGYANLRCDCCLGTGVEKGYYSPIPTSALMVRGGLVLHPPGIWSCGDMWYSMNNDRMYEIIGAGPSIRDSFRKTLTMTCLMRHVRQGEAAWQLLTQEEGQ